MLTPPLPLSKSILTVPAPAGNETQVQKPLSTRSQSTYQCVEPLIFLVRESRLDYGPQTTVFYLTMFVSTYHPDLGVMIHDSQDNVSLADLLLANQYWFGHDMFDPTRPVIWDLHDCPITISIDEMRNVFSVTRRALGDRKRQGGVTAWVHSTALVRAMIEMVRDEFNWGSSWETFDERSEAIKWCLNNNTP